MTRTELDAFASLEAAVIDPSFAWIDVRLRKGEHIGPEDVRATEYLARAWEHLQRFYAAYRCRLVRAPEGYAYLMSDGDRLPVEHLDEGEMLVGIGLAMMVRDPRYLRSGGRITETEVVRHLELTFGEDVLRHLLAPRQRGLDPIQDDKKVRKAVHEAVVTLQKLGFVEQDVTGVLPRTAIQRFVDYARRPEAVAAAIRRLAAEGEVAVPQASTVPDAELETEDDLDA